MRRASSCALLLVLLVLTLRPGSAAVSLWSDRFGTGGEDRVISSARDSAGGLVVGGIAGGALASSGRAAPDGFVRRYSPSGRVLWTRQISVPSFSMISAVALRRDGGVDAVMSAIRPAKMPSVAATILAFDKHGRLIRRQPFGPPMSVYPEAVPDGAGGAVVLGATWRTVANGSHERFLRRYDKTGRLVWTVTVPFGRNAETWSALARDRGGLIVSGLRSGSEGPAGVLTAFDLAGRKRWAVETPEQIFRIAVHDSTIVSVGARTTAAGIEWVVRSWSAEGTLRWLRTFGRQEFDDSPVVSALAVSDDAVAITGEVAGRPAGQGSLLFALVYDAAGDTTWLRMLPGRDVAYATMAELQGRTTIVGGSVSSRAGSRSMPDDVFVTALRAPDCAGSMPVRDERGCRAEIPSPSVPMP